MNTCGDCKYYRVNDKVLTDGFCCVNPPTSFALPTQKGIMIQAFDPSVSNDRNACEKFSPKITQ